DAVEIAQAVTAIVDLPGPVYLRLKRGEIPSIFGADHEFSLEHANVLSSGEDVALFASGMMLSAALAAAEVLAGAGVSVGVVNVPVIKPLDAATIAAAAGAARCVVSAENHSVVGGLGSAVAEVLAEAGLGRRLRRVGLRDTFAEGAQDATSLFRKYGLTTQDVVDAAWDALGREGAPPRAPVVATPPGEYAPV
ncbi:MAG: transketolase, partial [Acidobacteriota bacterium]|nr:transketolase [Acidobacteriota bacterium]